MAEVARAGWPEVDLPDPPGPHHHHPAGAHPGLGPAPGLDRPAVRGPRAGVDRGLRRTPGLADVPVGQRVPGQRAQPRAAGHPARTCSTDGRTSGSTRPSSSTCRHRRTSTRVLTRWTCPTSRPRPKPSSPGAGGEPRRRRPSSSGSVCTCAPPRWRRCTQIVRRWWRVGAERRPGTGRQPTTLTLPDRPRLRAADRIPGAVAQLARAPALQAGGRGFESHQLHSAGPRPVDAA